MIGIILVSSNFLSTFPPYLLFFFDFHPFLRNDMNFASVLVWNVNCRKSDKTQELSRENLVYFKSERWCG